MDFPPAGRYVGFNDDAGAALHGLSAVEYLELSRTIGGNVMRTNLDWRHAEPVRDQWAPEWWARWRLLYDAAIERGMRPVFIVGFAPPWAREPAFQTCANLGGCEYPPARSMDDEWAEYVAEVARRFPEALIEVWNEPNLRTYWESGADPQRFAELLAIADDAVEAVSPETVVLAGGLSNNQSTGLGNMALREFLDRAYSATPSIAGHMDAISFHPYPTGPGLGEDTLFAKSFDDVRTVRAAHGDVSTPLFVSEVGVSTGSPELLTEAVQADTMMRVYRRTMTMPDVVGVVFHRAIEPLDTTNNSWELGTGWTRYGENPPLPREVYCRFVADSGHSYPGCPGEAPLTTVIESGPGAAVNSRDVRFGFESPSYGARYECSFDEAPFSACWTEISYQGLAEGPHSFSVRAIGSDGVVQAEPTVRAFTVDLVAPETSFAEPPPAATRGDEPLTLAASEASVSFECAFDDEPFTACSESVPLAHLPEGDHRIAARAIDLGGNLDPTPATAELRIDRRAPEVGFTAVADPASAAAVEIAADEPGVVFECSLDGAEFVACGEGTRPALGGSTASFSAADLAEGEHTLAVRAHDPAGNVGEAVASFSVDTTPPETRARGLRVWSGGDRARLRLIASEPDSSFECSLDGSPWAACASQHRFEVGPRRRHKILARAVDAAGNADPSPAVRRFGTGPRRP